LHGSGTANLKEPAAQSKQSPCPPDDTDARPDHRLVSGDSIFASYPVVGKLWFLKNG